MKQHISKEDLYDHFLTFGPVKQFQVGFQPVNGAPSGDGFVDYRYAKSATNALKAGNITLGTTTVKLRKYFFVE